jgi:hypothetical protein
MDDSGPGIAGKPGTEPQPLVIAPFAFAFDLGAQRNSAITSVRTRCETLRGLPAWLRTSRSAKFFGVSALLEHLFA